MQLKRRALGGQLRLCRQHAGIGQAELGRSTGYAHSSISHLEAGRQRAPREFWERADASLHANGALLAEFDRVAEADADLALARASADREKAGRRLARTDPPTSSSPTRRSAGAEPARDATCVASAALHWLVHPAGESLSAGGPGPRVGMADVTRLRAARGHLKEMDNSLGGAAAYPVARDYLHRDAVPLLRGSYSDAVGRELYGIMAQLTLDLGWMAYDNGRHTLGRKEMLRALELAQAGGHQLFGGRVLSALSHQALHLGRVAEAIDLASAALAGTRRVSQPVAVAMFAAMLACSHAAHGDGRATDLALLQAERALAGRSESDEVPTWLDFDHGGLAGHAARAYRDIGRPKTAREFADNAVSTCHAGHSRTRAQRRAILATVLAQSGEHDHAAQVASQVVADAWSLRSAHVVDDVARLVQLLDPSQSSTTFAMVSEGRRFLASRAPRSR